jgi:zinc transport system substrate-binding protein
MTAPRGALAAALLALAALTSLAGVACDGGSGRPVQRPAAPPVQAVVSVPPLAWVVERVGGERVTVEVMIPPGTSPHAYEPSPRAMAVLDRADLFVAVGHPHLAFERQHVEPALARREGIAVVRLVGSGGAAAGPARDADPHVWLSPSRMAAAAREVAAALARIDPAGAASYRRNLAAVEAEIAALDAELRAHLAGSRGRSFLVYHPAWAAFGEEYGLTQVAIERGGKEPGPRELARLVAEARRAGVDTVFVQQGFSDRPARVVAREIGARVVPLDPLARDWAANLRRAAGAIAAAAGDGGGAPHREAAR